MCNLTKHGFEQGFSGTKIRATRGLAVTRIPRFEFNHCALCDIQFHFKIEGTLADSNYECALREKMCSTSLHFFTASSLLAPVLYTVGL